jgi:hypothetical protein
MELVKPREVQTHQLKIWPEYFERVVDGTKTFEFRKFDRDYVENDHVVLKEWDNTKSEYTGNEIRFNIGYVLPVHAEGDKFCVFSLLDGPMS